MDAAKATRGGVVAGTAETEEEEAMKKKATNETAEEPMDAKAERRG